MLIHTLLGISVFVHEPILPLHHHPTQEHRKLKTGDEVMICIWENTLTNLCDTITSEGNLNLPHLGPVHLAGKTLAQAEAHLKKISSTFVKLSFGKARSVTVAVTGEVMAPGSYTLPAEADVLTALSLAGGPNEIGSMRNIRLYRGDSLLNSLDLYQLFLHGSQDTETQLKDKDIISVAPCTGKVTVSGGVKRPMRYEMLPGESLEHFIAYAGGFSPTAYRDAIHVTRIGSSAHRQHAKAFSVEVPRAEFTKFEMQPGDEMTVRENSAQLANRVIISGQVWRPGGYAIRGSGTEAEGITTLRQLIEAAGGVKEEAYRERGYLVRRDESGERKQLSFSLQAVLESKEELLLYPDDLITILSVLDVTPKSTVTIYGELNHLISQSPSGQAYPYRQGMTLGDLILMAGGGSDAAALNRVEVARRITKETEEIRRKDTVAVVYHYDLLQNPEKTKTPLKPFDIVFVRRAFSHEVQQTVYLKGEVNYPGAYAMEKKVTRLSDVIKNARGFTADAYTKGANLTRILTREEYNRLGAAKELARLYLVDKTEMDLWEIGDRYNVAIDLTAAMANPGSDADVVLRKNDEISVPQFNNTVKVSGAVFYPNTITYDPKFSWKRYVSNAGGVLQKGLKRKIYMVHPNGSVVAFGHREFKVQPGTEIIVPTREHRNVQQTLSTIFEISVQTTSLIAMAALMLQYVK